MPSRVHRVGAWSALMLLALLLCAATAVASAAAVAETWDSLVAAEIEWSTSVASAHMQRLTYLQKLAAAGPSAEGGAGVNAELASVRARPYPCFLLPRLFSIPIFLSFLFPDLCTFPNAVAPQFRDTLGRLGSCVIGDLSATSARLCASATLSTPSTACVAPHGNALDASASVASSGSDGSSASAAGADSSMHAASRENRDNAAAASSLRFATPHSAASHAFPPFAGVDDDEHVFAGDTDTDPAYLLTDDVFPRAALPHIRAASVAVAALPSASASASASGFVSGGSNGGDAKGSNAQATQAQADIGDETDIEIVMASTATTVRIPRVEDFLYEYGAAGVRFVNA
jgi:hypothetical protein